MRRKKREALRAGVARQVAAHDALWAMTLAQADQRLTSGTLMLGDARPHDPAPDRCWRCDAARGETDVGLCPTCHADLTAS